VTLIPVSDPHDPRLVDYTGLTDVALRSRREPDEGLYMAESAEVIGRALDAGHRPRSLLMEERWVDPLDHVIARSESAAGGDLPVYVATPAVVHAITGFRMHRGALASMHRPSLPDLHSLLAVPGRRRVVVLEDIVDHTNVGAIIRSVAALGADVVLATPRCADPLYRRAVRVSMGTVFQVPWTRIDPWPGGIAALHETGYTVAALALAADAVSLDEFTAPDRLALVLGTEGHGLGSDTLAATDVRLRIPMSGGVDSLNVAAASAVALWAVR
jgi:tRNA G18 (ribose-2'-O)-methylase SpoU